MQKLNSKRTYSEIHEILNILGEDYIHKVPRKLYDLIEQERDLEYNPNLLMEDGSLDEEKISREAIALLAVLDVKYFMEDEQEKQEFFDILNKNEQQYQVKLREKYNPDNIFKKTEKNTISEIEEQTDLVEYKESFFKRIMSKIKDILKISK